MVEKISESINVPRFFFTAPWEPLIVRRGDALGMGALADQFADAVAPDFSNRIRDGRWVTILAWCLVKSHQAFHASGGCSVTTRAEQNRRYAWLRPLELMWVARTISLLKENDEWRQRSLAGQRRVAPWLDKNQAADRFGMSPEQFRAYRQTGMYGGYRRAFRKWPGMTLHGDGWTPGPATKELARWLDTKLNSARLQLGEEISSSSAKRGHGKEDLWWRKNWMAFDQSGRNADLNTLPRPKDDFTVLPEAKLLETLIFGDDLRGKKRRNVVRSIENTSAKTHLELCKHLSSEFGDNPVIAQLYSFSLLADAGMAAMDLVAEVLRAAMMRDKPYVALKEVAQHKDAVSVCKALMTAAQAWKKIAETKPLYIRHIQSANNFAGAINTGQPIECLRALLHHHKTYGGGLRWFVLKNEQVEPLTLPAGSASRYGFRLWSLCRLATQCGVLKTMPAAALRDESADLEEGDEQ